MLNAAKQGDENCKDEKGSSQSEDLVDYVYVCALAEVRGVRHWLLPAYVERQNRTDGLLALRLAAKAPGQDVRGDEKQPRQLRQPGFK